MFPVWLHYLEKMTVKDALMRHNFDISRTARYLGMKRGELWTKIKGYRLEMARENERNGTRR